MVLARSLTIDSLDSRLAQPKQVKWDAAVRRAICPQPDQTFPAWRLGKGDWFKPLRGAAVPVCYQSELEPDSLTDFGGASTKHHFVALIDLSAPKRQILDAIEWIVDTERVKRSGRPTGPGHSWVEFAPNGHVDVESLRASLFVYRRLLRSLRSGKRITNRELFDKLHERNWRLVEMRSRAERARRRRRKGTRPPRPAIATDVDVQSAIIARHLARARSIVRAVRKGRFPEEHREQAKGKD
jgi:hypothetical protein